jgi:hypothetical protein
VSGFLRALREWLADVLLGRPTLLIVEWDDLDAAFWKVIAESWLAPYDWTLEDR